MPIAVIIAALLVTTALAGGAQPVANLFAFPNPAGEARTFSTSGAIHTRGPFFQSLGTNGRTCVTCHRPEEGWSITPAGVQARFEATSGMDPIFRTVDGANTPYAYVGTVEARRKAFSLLLTKGLIRIALPVPEGAEFTVEAVDDPYGNDLSTLSLFRRPLPATNLPFHTTIMWDGRETQDDLAVALANQANGATLRHAERTLDVPADVLAEIVDFETDLFHAQTRDLYAQNLHAAGALGGPHVLSTQTFYVGINDSRGGDPTGAPFDRRIFRLFDAWENASGQWAEARREIARGQRLFNEKTFGTRTCGNCHNAPNVGTSSTNRLFDIGTSDGSRRTPDLPLYTLRCLTDGQRVETTDPGRALITGKCADIGRFKVPSLRGLAARAPYFHDGSAATLEDVVEFYDQRFRIGLTAQEKADMAAFLRAL